MTIASLSRRSLGPCARALAAFLLAPSLALAQPDMQVLSPEDLAQSGATRLSDIFELAHGWVTSSTDGYAWDASVLGLAQIGEPAWRLFLDDAPVDLRVLGGQNINTLPVSIAEICRVELHTAPTLVGGVFAPAGALHLRTCQPPQGLSVRGVVGAGSETGDPGPFFYTGHGGPNVDRTGPTAQISAAARRGPWHLRVQGKADEHHATDARIRSRVHTLFRGDKDARIVHRSASADVGFSGSLGRHTLFGSIAQVEDHAFFEPLGLEAPANHNFLFARLAGDIAREQPYSFRYRISATRSRIATRPNPRLVNVDWRQDGLRFHFAGQLRSGRISSALGLRANYLRTWGIGMRARKQLLLAAAFGRLSVRFSDAVDLSSLAELSESNGRRGFQALGALRAALSHDQELRLSVFLVRRALYADHNLWYWIGEGYAPLGQEQDRIQVMAHPRPARMASVDMAWRIGLSEHAWLRLSGGVRRHLDHGLVTYRPRFDSVSTGLKTHTEARIASFDSATAAAELEARLLPSLTIGVHGALLRGKKGHAAHPRSIAHARARFTPNSRFSMMARLRFVSGAKWADFQAAALEAPGLYAAALPQATLVDLTIQKRFWGDYLLLGTTLRNILDQAYLSHPAGALTHLSFHLRVQFFIGFL